MELNIHTFRQRKRLHQPYTGPGGQSNLIPAGLCGNFRNRSSCSLTGPLGQGRKTDTEASKKTNQLNDNSDTLQHALSICSDISASEEGPQWSSMPEVTSHVTVTTCLQLSQLRTSRSDEPSEQLQLYMKQRAGVFPATVLQMGAV